MIIFFNDKFCDETESVVPMKNRGMYFGEGIFETMRAYNGKVFAIEQHLQRLFSSAKYFSLPISFSISELNEICNQVLQRNNLYNAIIRLTLSGGEISSSNHFSSKPTSSLLFIETKEFQPSISELVTLHISEERFAAKDELRKHKTTNVLRNILALRKFTNDDVRNNEVMFLDEHNYILEGTRTNIFLVLGDAVVTPSLACDILPGVTRTIVKDICIENTIPYEERMIHSSAMYIASEIFLTNSLAEIVSVASMNNISFTQKSAATKLKTFYKEKVFRECYPR
jgi:branched-chain amino acid aminotransferase